MKPLKSFFLALGSLVLVCLYPCLFQFATNAPESVLLDGALFFGIFLGLGLLVLLGSFLILRKWGAAGLFADLTMLVVMNGGLLIRAVRKVLPALQARYPLLVLLLALLAALVLLKRKGWNCQVPCILMALVFGVLSGVSLAMGAPAILGELRQNQAREDSLRQRAEAADEIGRRPNVYYYLYDEYGGPENLRYYYDYDNSAFYQALEERGFSCSADSYNTESCATVQLVPNLYDLSYDLPPYFNSGDGVPPKLYQLFLDRGYQVNLISHNDFLDTDGASSLTDAQQEDSICVYLYQNSLLNWTPLARFVTELPQLRTLAGAETMVQEVLGYLESAWEYTGTTPTLTLGYVQLPHTWFLYDKDGNLQPEDQWLNWKDPQYYLGQLEYTNQRILDQVDSILAHDPEAIIILQSDHGARKGYHMEELYGGPYDPETETIHQQNILNCVYLGGEAVDISGLSGINTLRTVLNQTFGMDYEMLPSPTGFVNYYP